jgi:alpha-mannosidase
MTQTSDRWRIFLVPHTHWDREWYFPYQRYRTRLAGFFDLLLDILERDPDYKHFMLDGHTILVEDYLEVRPDRRDAIERFVREGRITVGPWYVIPDEFLPSGEALVRNLLRGHRVAQELGGVMRVGYLPDPFGQIAHLPAILRGFGIERCVFWRGVDAALDTTDFVWEAPDGSEVLVKHLRGGYGFASPFPTEEDTFLEKIEELRARLQPFARTRALLVMWGSDHVPPQRGLSRAVRAANARLGDAEIVHGSIPQMFDELEAALAGVSLPRRRGEFRCGQFDNVLPGVLSARVWIKQRTFACEQLLTRWAEPFVLWSEQLRCRLGETWSEPSIPSGPASPPPHEPASEHGLLDRAWRLLLENQPHDSICGCSVDQTHAEMRPRFDQCDQIGDDLTHQALRRIGAQGPAERVYVFNPLPGPRRDYVSAVVPAREDLEPVALVDERGRRIPCQLLADGDLPPGRVPVGFVAGDVPGFGYATYAVEYGAPPRPQRPSRSARRIENEFFRVEADPRNGTLAVTDKRSGVQYRGLNRFVDGGDRGDEYNYCPPERDVVLSTPDGPPRIRVVEDGQARSTLEVRMTYRLPARLGPDRRRIEASVACPIRVYAALSPGVPRIDINVELTNRAEDHRLRVHFPTGIGSDVAHAEQHFGVVTRSIALPEADETWQEQPVGCQPQKSFVDVDDGERGLLIANRGLQEYEALAARGGVTIALTLLRCVGWLSRGDYPARRGHAGPPLAAPGAQLPGRHLFDYAIVPHAGGWEQAYAEAHRFATPLRARWNPRGCGTLPPRASFLELEGEGIVVSALKRAEDGEGAVVRLYNTLDSSTHGRLRLTEPWSRAELADMKEEVLGPADAHDGWVEIRLRPNQIVTLRFS